MEQARDQARTLRELMKNRLAPKPEPLRPVRVLSVTSGKGGVGKTNVVANLAVTLQRLRHRVLVLDGDFGLSNLNIVMGLDAKYTINDVLAGEKSMRDIVLTGPAGVRLIPASSGVLKMTQLTLSEKNMLMDCLEALPSSFDFLIIDTGAGIHSDVAYLNAIANEVIVVATPEPTSIADAYALMKVMSQSYGVKNFKLLANMVESEKEAHGVYNNLVTVADRFLSVRIEYLGHVLEDPKLAQAVMSRTVVCEAFPDSISSKCFEGIARTIHAKSSEALITGNLQFFWRSLLSARSLENINEAGI